MPEQSGIDVQKQLQTDARPSVDAAGINTNPQKTRLDDPRQTLENIRRAAVADSGKEYGPRAVSGADIKPADASTLQDPIDNLKQMQGLSQEQRDALGLD